MHIAKECGGLPAAERNTRLTCRLIQRSIYLPTDMGTVTLIVHFH
ncbi:hypothetical protein Poly51_02220 [Rubripirellula tenax]|uniref:Uncharacterized protein n=1 Tax=Rubripirellula tenax TaxID=2528015 RepID=A0A5C6FIR3_9BACT|nr:hypothetical protein Poly51_02220 [Rubripirellula tenax]